MRSNKPDQPAGKSEFLRHAGYGAALGLAVLVVVVPWMRSGDAPQPPAQPPAVQAPGTAGPPTVAAPADRPGFPGMLPDFGAAQPSDEVRHLANWAFFTGDPGGRAAVILDKEAAQVYAFDPQGRLVSSSPALLGSAIGDDTAPGVGDKPLAEIRPEEKTTPAGRFVAEPGLNLSGEDVVWIDYDAAVSIHRVRDIPDENRMQRLASPTHEDNRISFGCVNVPVPFYESVVSPAVRRSGAVIYVLPETRTAQEVFGSFDVTDPQAVQSALERRAATAAAPARQPPQREARSAREYGG